MMVTIDLDKVKFETEPEFVQTLLDEENVFVLPGSCFHTNGMFRVVVTQPIQVYVELRTRVIKFMKRHQSDE